MNFLRSIFGFTDRTAAASDRAARAMEDIADILEGTRDALASRLGSADGKTGPDVIDAPEAPQRLTSRKQRASA